MNDEAELNKSRERFILASWDNHPISISANEDARVNLRNQTIAS